MLIICKGQYKCAWRHLSSLESIFVDYYVLGTTMLVKT